MQVGLMQKLGTSFPGTLYLCASLSYTIFSGWVLIPCGSTQCSRSIQVRIITSLYHITQSKLSQQLSLESKKLLFTAPSNHLTSHWLVLGKMPIFEPITIVQEQTSCSLRLISPKYYSQWGKTGFSNANIALCYVRSGLWSINFCLQGERWSLRSHPILTESEFRFAQDPQITHLHIQV